VQLNAKNVFISDKKRVESWSIILEDALKKLNSKRDKSNMSM
jgi:hypothetical protein